MIDGDDSCKFWGSVNMSLVPPKNDRSPQLLIEQEEVKLAVERLTFAANRTATTQQQLFLAVGSHHPHMPYAPSEFYDTYLLSQSCLVPRTKKRLSACLVWRGTVAEVPPSSSKQMQIHS